MRVDETVDLLRLIAAGDRAAVTRSLNALDLRRPACRTGLLLAADLLELTPEGLAAKDAASVIAAADPTEHYGVACDLEQYGHSCLVSGSMLAPSWRALSGGAKVWERDDVGEASERYTEALDDVLDGWTGPDGETIGWEDGDLFVFRAGEEGDGDRRD